MDLLRFEDILGTDEDLSPDMELLCASMPGSTGLDCRISASPMLPDWTPRTALALDAPEMSIKDEPCEARLSFSSCSAQTGPRVTASRRLLPGRCQVVVCVRKSSFL